MTKLKVNVTYREGVGYVSEANHKITPQYCRPEGSHP